MYLLSLALFLFYETLLSRTFWTGERYVGETKVRAEGEREGWKELCLDLERGGNYRIRSETLTVIYHFYDRKKKGREGGREESAPSLLPDVIPALVETLRWT